ncbi:MAG: cytochrome P450 [Chloroflexi bacterium]|nr:MAG: cytochrome P450 [Chloroflexota bacterium]MBL1197031.1 cytochrome P450 [Chloroflexota bacterium]NOH14326.1 cytochrome P450 [Chloroflexota bacterium]
MMSLSAPPIPTGPAGLSALRALLEERNLMAALSALHKQMGNIFQITLPGFNPVVMVGPEANRFVLVSGRENFLWRNETDPVTALLQRGVLVVDGAEHSEMRHTMNPSLHKQAVASYVEAMVAATDQVLDKWPAEDERDMLVEMRKVALLVLMQTMFHVDFENDLHRMWKPLMKNLKFISPGLWLIWGGMPRPGYQRARQQMDQYLHEMITTRRSQGGANNDLLGLLVESYEDDELVRDQLLTMLIAGHDTSTSLLTWVLNLIGQHPLVYERMRAEVDQILGVKAPNLENIGKLDYLDQVVKETLRLYPPIHLGARVAAQDIDFQGHRIQAGARVIYSIYLTQRMEAYWDQPDSFNPDRFEAGKKQVPYTYLPFGGGPRNCIGFAFTQIEAKVVLARILQRFDLHRPNQKVHLHMGATLEPRPGVKMQIQARK